MVVWDLSQIITKVRNITGTPIAPDLTSDLSDTQITDYINTYYSFTMPFELKEQINLQPINFNVTPNTDVYSFPPGTIGYLINQPMAYCDGFPLIFYQDRDIFFQDWPQQYGSDNVATGNNTMGPYTGSTQGFPVIIGTFEITDGTQIATDSGNLVTPGVPFIYSLTGDGTGQINYLTGAFSVTFTNNVATTATIYDKYQAYQPARPQGVLFYDNEFTFRPVPDQVYVTTMQGFISQIQLSGGDSPLQTEWGQLIAYGASLEIYADRGDLGAYNNTYPILKRYENVALARTVQQYDASQSVPRF